MKYTFRETVALYTTIEADSENEAKTKLDQVVMEVPSYIDMVFFDDATLDNIEN